ncbi:MAG: DUF2062 domain-containing protein [Rubrimonas sp.]|uniref:DUF2062 domain-containing protein n=1 Tax=Rubrimonas sp. TaxID=2036015 RepID=UPI002FDEE56C
MIFKRREKPGFLIRLRGLLAPRKGWRRGFSYVGRRVQRLPDTPHKIALGFACGAFASFTPLFTLHILVALAVAWALRANLFAAALGTIVGNPLTFPAIAALSLEIGGWMTGKPGLVKHFSPSVIFSDFRHFLDDLMLPYLLGGLAPGLAAAAASYILLRPAIAAYQAARRRKLMESARRRLAAHVGRRPLKTGAPTPDPAE